MHNLKHNHVLHDRNVVLTIRTSDLPRVAMDEQVSVARISQDFTRIVAKVGYMETPNVPRILGKACSGGVGLDIMQTSFFLARFQVKPAKTSQMPEWQHTLFTGLARLSNDATDFFDIPSGRVVWLGGQVTI